MDDSYGSADEFTKRNNTFLEERGIYIWFDSFSYIRSSNMDASNGDKSLLDNLGAFHFRNQRLDRFLHLTINALKIC